MQEHHLFEYAVLRVVPHVEREEFINAGIILYCPAQAFLKTIFQLDTTRIHALCDKVDMEELHGYFLSFEKICAGGTTAGPIGKLPIAERFRWLTAARSTVLQTSPVHPGLCQDANEMLIRLYNQLVKRIV
jgi:hypothetical protein